MSILPGCEPLFVEGGTTGVLISHGFSGSGLSIRPWAEHLATAGHTVSMPLLPGHGTRWQDLERTGWQDWYGEVERHYLELTEKCSRVFVFGFSMGGALALRVAEQYPDEVAGLVLLNPSLGSRRPGVRLLATAPALARVIRTTSSIGGDVKKADAPRHTGYERVPTRAAYQLIKLWRTTRRDLARVTAPVLVFRSRVDHVVDDLSIKLLRAGARNTQVEERILENSYHNACLDHDAPLVLQGSAEWIQRHGASVDHHADQAGD